MCSIIKKCLLWNSMSCYASSSLICLLFTTSLSGIVFSYAWLNLLLHTFSETKFTVFIKSVAVYSNTLGLHIHSPLTHPAQLQSCKIHSCRMPNTGVAFLYFILPLDWRSSMFRYADTDRCVAVAYRIQHSNKLCRLLAWEQQAVYTGVQATPHRTVQVHAVMFTKHNKSPNIAFLRVHSYHSVMHNCIWKLLRE